MALENVTLKVPISEKALIPHTIRHLVIKGESVIAQPPVIFLGHSLGSPQIYQNTANHLSFFGDVYVPMLTSLFGHDRANNVALLESYLDSQKLDHVSLIGYRYGTLVASEFTKKHANAKPYCVDQLTLLDPGAIDLANFSKKKVEIINAAHIWPSTFVIGLDKANPDHKVQSMSITSDNSLYDAVTQDEIAENVRRNCELSNQFAVPKYGFRKVREVMPRVVSPDIIEIFSEARAAEVKRAIAEFDYHSRPHMLTK